jgi:hypothetical protein
LLDVDVGHAGARREKIAREQLRMQLPPPRAEIVALPGTCRGDGDIDHGVAAPAHRWRPSTCRLRASLVFGVLALLFAGLTGRSVYLQSVDHEFLQTQGSARCGSSSAGASRRIIDRSGEALALSTPMKTLWAFPDKFDATPQQLAELARILETTPQSSPRAGRQRGLRVSRAADRAQNRIARWRAHQVTIRTNTGGSTGRRVTTHIIGSPATAWGGRYRALAAGWLSGVPGSRRVSINRRFEASGTSPIARRRRAAIWRSRSTRVCSTSRSAN